MKWLSKLLDLLFGDSEQKSSKSEWTQKDINIHLNKGMVEIIDHKIALGEKVIEKIIYDSLEWEQEFELKRKTFTKKSAIGELWLRNDFICYTLEDRSKKIRGVKIYGETAIPIGTYKIVITHSKKFHRRLPLLKNVPGFKGIRIHTGNTAIDTKGCILVGDTRGKNFIGRSRKAFKALYKQLRAIEKRGQPISIKITEER